MTPRLLNIEIGDVDDDVAVISIETNFGTILAIGRIYRQGGDVILEGVHVEGLSRGVLGTGIWHLACEVLRSL